MPGILATDEFHSHKSSSFLTLELGFIHYLRGLALFKLGRDVEGLHEARVATNVFCRLGEKDLARETSEEIKKL
jgi:hypothetical protein